MEDIEEYKALTKTLSAFYNFHQWQTKEVVAPRVARYASFTDADKELLPWYSKHTLDLQECVSINQQFTQQLALAIAQDWGVSPDPSQWARALASDYDKVRFTFLQLAREWSDDGAKEREAYSIITKELEEMYPDINARQNIKILNPGCGLGRLVMELIKRGFWCQGNEFSYHMLLTLSFILNHCRMIHSYSIMPYLHKASNLVKRLHQIRPITIPDINPLEIHELQKENPQIPYDDLMSMTAGSFTDLYGPGDLSISDTYSNDRTAADFRASTTGTFDCVVTCFFLDTAPNIIDYIKTIHSCLKQNGTWINFGPLLWHFENPILPDLDNRGLELSREDLYDLVKKLGFTFKKRESELPTTYSGDPKSLGSYVYKCEYWVCVKD